MKFIFIFFLSLSSIALAKETCPSGQHWVKAHFRKSYTRSDGTLVKASNVTAHCRTLSREAAYLQPRFKDTAPKIWANKTEKSKAWQEHEKELVEDALQEVPDLLLLDSIEGLYRMVKSKDFPNPASNMKGHIALYDTAFSRDKGLGRILVHELAHQLYLALNGDENISYRLAAGESHEFAPNGKILWEKRIGGYVSEDGNSSTEEDFSNNIEYYLYEPVKLKGATPNVYSWIQKKYGNKLNIRKLKK